MKNLLKYPFLWLLVLTAVLVMPFAWQQIGLLPEGILPTVSLTDGMPQIVLPQPEEPQMSGTEPPTEVPTEPVTQPPTEPVTEPVTEPATEPATEPPTEVPTEPPAPPKPENPFEDALFIGDSRTVGISKYSGIKDAEFFASTGMTVFNVFKEEVKVGDREACSLERLLLTNEYDRIYLTLGINELGSNMDRIVEHYTQVVARLRQLQPRAYIHLQANLHVAKKRSDTDKTYNNENINRLNEAIAAMADGQWVFYLDPNPVFDDENGAMTAGYTWDDIHLLGKHYVLWTDWLRENTPA